VPSWLSTQAHQQKSPPEALPAQATHCLRPLDPKPRNKMKPTGHSLIDQEIGKRLGEDEVVLLADGLESAFLGIGRQFTHPVAIYSYKKTIKCLKGMGMTIEDAEEYFDYNIAGAFVGDQTPVFLQDE
jgi:hypothetical protein